MEALFGPRVGAQRQRARVAEARVALMTVAEKLEDVWDEEQRLRREHERLRLIVRQKGGA